MVRESRLFRTCHKRKSTENFQRHWYANAFRRDPAKAYHPMCAWMHAHTYIHTSQSSWPLPCARFHYHLVHGRINVVAEPKYGMRSIVVPTRPIYHHVIVIAERRFCHSPTCDGKGENHWQLNGILSSSYTTILDAKLKLCAKKG